jgi:hypothetical protein
MLNFWNTEKSFAKFVDILLTYISSGWKGPFWVKCLCSVYNKGKFISIGLYNKQKAKKHLYIWYWYLLISNRCPPIPNNNNRIFSSWTLNGYSHSARRTTLLSPVNLTVVRRDGVQLKEQPEADSIYCVSHCLPYKPVQWDPRTKLFII